MNTNKKMKKGEAIDTLCEFILKAKDEQVKTI